MFNLAVTALIAAELMSSASEIEPTGHFYAQTAIITDMNYDFDVVMTTTLTGRTRIFYGTEDWFVGDVCSILMYDNGTPEIYDDIIVDVNYSGSLDSISAGEEGVTLNFPDGTGYYYEYWEAEGK